MIHSLTRWLGERLVGQSPVIVARIINVLGSAPRDTDAVMLVTREECRGTVGGGALEWTVIEDAREMIAQGVQAKTLSLPLGPFLGQCCGGHVTLELFKADLDFARSMEAKEEERLANYPRLMILGSGHVGRAIARATMALPFTTQVVDTRQEEIALLPAGVTGVLTTDPVHSIEAAEPTTSFVILTHSHTMDFLAVEAALKRTDAPYVGMIGSATKRTKLRNWLASSRSDTLCLSRLVCPIGGARVRDKRPEVIAALVAAELITVLSLSSARSKEPQGWLHPIASDRKSASS